MSRTKLHNSAAALHGERHFNRSGYQDPRGLPKKEGAGGFNWGRPIDELEAIKEVCMPLATRRDSKINIVDPSLFESIHGR
ncbi:hypothetical protein K493DRAFT_314126 [Basidiobolus meristosporus CBS 931.73]|uniref:Hyaluronan/mRNA-binding protein domain-containing protein n=1 Tax=Basidiobolus meristosporus CBS 931.73 TaxID=1314790 RepID=A0A1Y1YH99_9FUNG|nr:hypothetical protein K493DRAFT_314126 [Basidiobolus meristosporus CBS 931.73]|eukprot:ORX97328.1 hypothetical protein K493DRAFT_314126 [Basidiobolus meristosporus CBS 931.73]